MLKNTKPKERTINHCIFGDACVAVSSSGRERRKTDGIEPLCSISDARRPDVAIPEKGFEGIRVGVPYSCVSRPCARRSVLCISTHFSGYRIHSAQERWSTRRSINHRYVSDVYRRTSLIQKRADEIRWTSLFPVLRSSLLPTRLHEKTPPMAS